MALRKSKPRGAIVCGCGKEFKDAERHHQHLHEEHPEHAH